MAGQLAVARLAIRWLTLTCVLSTITSAASATWHVDDNSCPGTGNGTLSNPFCRIQVAIDRATGGDTILVHPGTYFETIDFKGKAITVRSLAGAQGTVIDGQMVFHVVTFASGEGAASVMQGFTIKNGWEFGGGGIYCDGSAPTIRNNIVEGNMCHDNGAGIACVNSSMPAIVDNLIQGNQCVPGGGMGAGIYSFDSAPIIIGNTIRDNMVWDSGDAGGGMSLVNSAPILLSNLIANNFVTEYFGGGVRGGGIYCSSSWTIMIGNTIVGNLADGGGAFYPGEAHGGALFVGNSSSVAMVNCIAWDNTTSVTAGTALGDQIFVDGTSDLYISYSDFPNGLNDLHVVPPGQLTAGPGLLHVVPAFAGSTDYHLSPTSLLIDSGDPSTTRLGTDGDGDPRVLDGNGDGSVGVDIGWDELNVTTLSATGSPSVGGSWTLQVAAPTGQLYLLAISTGTADRAFGCLGNALLDLTASVVVGWGMVPATDVVNVPVMPTLLGLEVFAQAVARDPAGCPGSFSRRLHATIL